MFPVVVLPLQFRGAHSQMGDALTGISSNSLSEGFRTSISLVFRHLVKPIAQILHGPRIRVSVGTLPRSPAAVVVGRVDRDHVVLDGRVTISQSAAPVSRVPGDGVILDGAVAVA